MSITGQLSRPAERQPSMATDNFRSFSASLITQSETRLQRPGQLFASAAGDIATSISSTWVATSSSKQIRVYNVPEADKSRAISPKATLSIKLVSKHEGIRAIALSEDLLAVITHSHLLVYEGYKTVGDLSSSLFDTRSVDNDQCWTPKSLSISQTGTTAMSEGASASIAVGGEGENGVKVFKYAYNNGWKAQNDRLILKCPRNNGAVKIVGFSPNRRNAMYGPMAFALTTGNQLYCWSLGRSARAGMQSMQPSWHIDCNSTSNQRPYRDEISSAALIISPTGRPYMFCTVNHKQGSHLLPTFIVPVDMLEKDPCVLRHQMRPISDTIVGTNILAGFASSNGHFLVIIEKGMKKETLKILSLQGAYDGGLTCAARAQAWEAKLRSTGADTSAISISIEEQYGALQIKAVDGRGHVHSARVSVPDMPACEQPSLAGSGSTLELPHGAPIGELSSDESSRQSFATLDQLPERAEAIPG
ncbi:uncharacterized protein K460DRAFT_281331 [Cucurbitaria berberidis CBS 394.84]|uniref:WD40 repeat-like protein n=1 Tax=Cucurbitaria berberidis CBS 394.84 TaxID=1168544 RepID=A0A9P4GLR0_9PLEO|nr:uncharacterized protein K460DRAFT_281331 [Cucurbitaria berberidis CBS 394.84]KAF1847509.1 hypothetical protein K460DRAFT_281331 [Cucurbitaria berberidis CBS 394.84]